MEENQSMKFDIEAEFQELVDLIEKYVSRIAVMLQPDYKEEFEEPVIFEDELMNEVSESADRVINQILSEDLPTTQRKIMDRAKHIKDHIWKENQLSQVLYKRWVLVINQSTDRVRRVGTDALGWLQNEIINEQKYNEIRDAILTYRPFLELFNGLVVSYNNNPNVKDKLIPIVSEDVSYLSK